MLPIRFLPPRFLPARLVRYALGVSLLFVTGSVAARERTLSENWVATWGAAQTAPYGTETLPAGSFQGSTLREVVHLSAGGTRLQVRVSNVFGEAPLTLLSVHVALRSAATLPGGTDPGTDRTLGFGGSAQVAVPAGAEYLSDPVDLPVSALSDLVISMEIASAPETPTVHAGARATAFLQRGNHAAETQFSPGRTFTRWYFLSGVQVSGGPRRRGVVVALGDSITDGHGATTDGNDRWTDTLARRVNAGTTPEFGVVNEGIGGNRVLEDGTGPNTMARLGRDAFNQPGASTLLVLEGINDIGGLDRTEEHSQAVHQALVTALETAFRQMVTQAHQRGLWVVGATLTPFLGSGYYHPSPATEADRQTLNQWIRTSGTFDGVVDFDRVLRDPSHPDRLLPEADSGDHLHPGPYGYRRMGEAVPLALLH